MEVLGEEVDSFLYFNYLTLHLALVKKEIDWGRFILAIHQYNT